MRFKPRNTLSFFSFSLSSLFLTFSLISSLNSSASLIDQADFSSLPSNYFTLQNLSILANIFLLCTVTVLLFKSRKDELSESFLNQNNLNINLKVLESLKVNKQSSLFLVEVFREHLLIGLNPDRSLSLISQLSNKTSKASQAEQKLADKTRDKNYSGFLKEKTLEEIVKQQKREFLESTEKRTEKVERKRKQEIAIDYLPPQKISEIVEENYQNHAEEKNNQDSDRILLCQKNGFLGEKVKKENPWFKSSESFKENTTKDPKQENPGKIRSRRISIKTED